MGDFPIDESARDHANDLTASRQHRVGKQAHEADAGAAIHHRNPAPDKLRRKLDGRDTMFIA